jgi:pimeloyl-ACP methyl ester carboxylesterase
MAAGLADRRIRRDLVKYCRTKFVGADLIRATNSLKDFTGPALVLWSRNPVMPADHATRLTELTGGTLRQIDDAYVLVMLDQPERTACAIGEFLTS